MVRLQFCRDERNIIAGRGYGLQQQQAVYLSVSLPPSYSI